MSAHSDQFFETVLSWIEEKKEVLVVILLYHAGGNGSFEFFTNPENFKSRIEKLPAKTIIAVFREPQLPLRGVVDEEFLEKSKKLIPDGDEYLFTCLSPTKAGRASWYHNDVGKSHVSMEEDLRECLGERVALGLFPRWTVDSESVISATIPEQNGEVVRGAHKQYPPASSELGVS